MEQGWLGVVLGGGGVAFLGALFKGFQLLRDGARAREREAIAGLEKWREDSDKRAERALEVADYLRLLAAHWQSRAGTLEYELSRHGHPIPTPLPLPLPLEDANDD